MDVRQLAAIVAVADHGTFSAAARALYTVQSNVSGHVAKLEQELGTTLVDRSTSTMTEEGLRVVERARRVLHDIDDIAADIASVADDVSGEARIGAIGTTARWLWPQILREITQRHPKIRPLISEGSTTTIVPAVIAGQLNGAIVHLPIDDPELVVEPLFSEELFLLAPADHPLAAFEEMTLDQLHDVPLLLPPKGVALRRVLDRAAGAAGFTLRPQAEIDGVRLLAALAFDGFGAAIVPATAAPRDWSGDFRRIAVPELPGRVVAWVRRRRPAPNAATNAFTILLKELIAEHAPQQPGIAVYEAD